VALAQFQLSGEKELMRKLRGLPWRTQKKIMTAALREGSKPIIKAAKALVPKETTLLRRALGVRIKHYVTTKAHVAVIGARKIAAPKFRQGLSTGKGARDPRYYAHLVEHGTKPHAQKGVVLPGGFIRLFSSMHPGAEAQPFLGPAFKANKERALKIVKKEVAEGIVQAMRRL
jgi:HK97 gp10 family phage protein